MISLSGGYRFETDAFAKSECSKLNINTIMPAAGAWKLNGRSVSIEVIGETSDSKALVQKVSDLSQNAESGTVQISSDITGDLLLHAGCGISYLAATLPDGALKRFGNFLYTHQEYVSDLRLLNGDLVSIDGSAWGGHLIFWNGEGMIRTKVPIRDGDELERRIELDAVPTCIASFDRRFAVATSDNVRIFDAETFKEIWSAEFERVRHVVLNETHVAIVAAEAIFLFDSDGKFLTTGASGAKEVEFDAKGNLLVRVDTALTSRIIAFNTKFKKLFQIDRGGTFCCEVGGENRIAVTSKAGVEIFDGDGGLVRLVSGIHGNKIRWAGDKLLLGSGKKAHILSPERVVNDSQNWADVMAGETGIITLSDDQISCWDWDGKKRWSFAGYELCAAFAPAEDVVVVSGDETFVLTSDAGEVLVKARGGDRGVKVFGSSDKALCGENEVRSLATGKKLRMKSVESIFPCRFDERVGLFDQGTISIGKKKTEIVGQPNDVVFGESEIFVITNTSIASYSIGASEPTWNTESVGDFISVSMDGTVCASENLGAIEIRNAKTGELVRALFGHVGYITGLQFLSDGRLISSSTDGTAVMWENTFGISPVSYNPPTAVLQEKPKKKRATKKRVAAPHYKLIESWPTDWVRVPAIACGMGPAVEPNGPTGLSISGTLIFGSKEALEAALESYDSECLYEYTEFFI